MALYSDVNNTIQKTKLTTDAPAKDLGIVKDVAAISQSIDNIIQTRKGERLFLPEFGAQFEDVLFELMDDITSNTILSQVFEAVEQWETRIIVDYGSSTVLPDVDSHTYYIRLVFSIKGLSPEKFEYTGTIHRPE